MKRGSGVCAAVMLCFAVCARAEQKLPVVAVMPFEAAGIGQENADVFMAQFSQVLAETGSVSVADSHAVGALLAQNGLDASGLIDAEWSAAFAAEAGADFLAVGKLFALGSSLNAFVTLIGVNPAAVWGQCVREKAWTRSWRSCQDCVKRLYEMQKAAEANREEAY